MGEMNRGEPDATDAGAGSRRVRLEIEASQRADVLEPPPPPGLTDEAAAAGVIASVATGVPALGELAGDLPMVRAPVPDVGEAALTPGGPSAG